MGFQGKGIFGGFTGKVGHIVGYSRNGKSIIQSIGNRKGDISRAVWYYEDQLLVEPVNATVGNYWVDATLNQQHWTTGARSLKALKKGQGSIIFVSPISNNNSVIGLSSNIINYSVANHQTAIWLFYSNAYIYIDKIIVKIQAGILLGCKFKIDIDKDSTKYYIDNNTGSWVLIFEAEVVYSYPLYMVASMAGSTPRMEELQMGGFHFSE